MIDEGKNQTEILNENLVSLKECENIVLNKNYHSIYRTLLQMIGCKKFILFFKEGIIMCDKYEILREISEWEKEIDRLEDSDEDESEQIMEIRGRIRALKDVLEDAKSA